MTFMLLPRVVLWLPAVLQEIELGEGSSQQVRNNYFYQFLPTEVAADQVGLVVSSTGIEASLGHLLGSAGTIRHEGPVLERLNSGIKHQHLDVRVILVLLHVVTVNFNLT